MFRYDPDTNEPIADDVFDLREVPKVSLAIIYRSAVEAQIVYDYFINSLCLLDKADPDVSVDDQAVGVGKIGQQDAVILFSVPVTDEDSTINYLAKLAYNGQLPQIVASRAFKPEELTIPAPGD